MRRALLASVSCIALGAVPSAAATAPKGVVLRIAPGGTGTAASVTVNDGNGFSIVIGAINGASHTFTAAPGFVSGVPAGPMTVQPGTMVRPLSGKLSDGGVTPQDFGGSGSNQTVAATTVAGSAAVTLASALDWQNGEGIRLNHAGPAPTMGAPSGLTVSAAGITGSTSYIYTIAPLDAVGGVGPAIAGVTIANGAAMFTGYNGSWVNVAWTAAPGATGYAIFRTVSGVKTLVGLTGATVFTDYGMGTGQLAVPDWIPTVAPTVALNDWLLTKIVSGAGTAGLTLASAATTGLATTAYHDDGAAISAAVAAAALGPVNKTKFPCGTYNVAGPNPIVVGGFATIEGDGSCSQSFKMSPASDLFAFTAGNFDNVRNLFVNTTAFQTGGQIYDFLSGGSNNELSGLTVNGGFNVLYWPTGGGQNKTHDFTFNNFRNNGIEWDVGFAGNDITHDGIVQSDPLLNVGAGLWLRSGITMTWSNLNVTSPFYPILIQPAASQYVGDLDFSHVAGDGVSRLTGGNSFAFDASASGSTISRVRCTSCWGGAAPTGSNGIVLLNVDSFTGTSCQAAGNAQVGIYVVNSNTVTLTASIVQANSQQVSGASPGIKVAGSKHVTLTGSRSGTTAQYPTAIQSYGLDASDNTNDYLTVVGNDFSGSVTASSVIGTGIAHQTVSNNF